MVCCRKPLAKLDVHGTPRTAVIVSAVFYSLFALVTFGKLIVADVLLYSVALFLEFGALIQLRKTEPSLRGVFRIPLGRTGVAVLASLPMIVLVGVIGVSFADGEYGLPAVVGTCRRNCGGTFDVSIRQAPQQLLGKPASFENLCGCLR